MSKKRGFDADKTILDARKQEEREVSELIHKNFQLLNVMYPRNFDFQSCYCQDMFLKPNTKAFPFVMHYLFNILDPNEFKKRFYWPLDRTSENVFRTNTVQYLNYLNEKHNLGWGEIKAFLVVMPGGIKFMKLLSNLIDFVVDEEIKKVEKSLPESIDKNKLSFTQETVSQFVRSHEMFMSKSVAYKEKLDAEKTIMLDNSNKLERKLSEMLKDIDVTIDQVDEVFFHSFSYSNYSLFERTISKRVNEIEETEKYLDNLSEEIDKFYNDKHQFPCDKNLLVSSYNSIKSDYPALCPDNILTSDNKIQLSSLFNAFNCIYPAIENALGQCEETKKRLERYEFEVDELSKLQNEAMQLDRAIFKFENQVDEIKTDLDDIIKSTASDSSSNTPNRASTAADNMLKSKYISTPAIYLPNIEEPKSRLQFLENSINQSFNFANQTAIFSARPNTDKNNSLVGMSSKFTDPRALLRTVTKSTGRRNKQCRLDTTNLSALASRFKENEELFANDGTNLSATIIGPGTLAETPVNRNRSSTLSKEAAILSRRQAIREKLVDNHEITVSPDRIIFRKSQLQKSIHENDLDTISKSPSGRLEPLVKVNHDFDIPEIFITNSPRNSSELLDSFAIEENTVKEVDATMREAKDVQEANRTCIDIASFCLEFNKKLDFNAAKESIFNVSDTVLKDISF